MKRLQNRIAESRFTLPVTAVYGTAVWCAGGLIGGQLWMQFACFVASTYIMMELNTNNALIRIYNRMVSCAFIVLASAACFLFGDAGNGAAALCVTASYLMLFRTYQDRASMGYTYYAYLLMGLAGMFCVEALMYIPILWLLGIFCLQAPSWRNFFASLFGLATPYWFASVWFIYQDSLPAALTHFSRLTDIAMPPDYSIMTTSHLITFIYIMVIALTGIVHYLRTSYNDKIRTRMLYQFFIIMCLASAAMLVVMPRHYDFFMRMIIINTSPLIAHFIALTRTRITNIAFYIIAVSALLLTGYNLWTSSLLF